jgi:hypothetical protein
MGESWFDQLMRDVNRDLTRRRGLALLTSIAAIWWESRETRARGKRCKSVGKKCRRGSECCSRRCTQRQCACPNGMQSCRGRCFQPCPDDQFLTADCVCACKDSGIYCGGRCRAACEAGKVFDESCSCACPSDSVACDGRCVNLISEPDHCGACGNSCPDTFVCEGSRCVCPSNADLCQDRCLPGCGSGEWRNSNTCECECAPGYAVCNGRCIGLCVTGKEFDDQCRCVCAGVTEECRGTCRHPCSPFQQRLVDCRCVDLDPPRLLLVPSTLSAAPGDDVEITVRLQMPEGSHSVHLYSLVLELDPAVLTGLEFRPLRTGTGPSEGLFGVIEAVVNDPAHPELLVLSATIGVDIFRTIQRTEAIAIMRLRATGPAGSSSSISWRLCDPMDSRCGAGTGLYSKSPWDQDDGGENVLGGVSGAEILVRAG